ncbi:helix-turn-helix transcriptional regulator [Clostridium sp. YIM B02515]|uniref:Helix-turn-helix transcriptional regulator n=1 Tax=Clostridium rhizosphaerae TaxID=2803861 RepID=A0ABS1TCI7_9CLOT|nr:helix-turn-helix transcriptional regulator [Clostridium rhizosphaerae]MBL4937079.1 helix-turn-helix transcriptional regulator [Clostridium rhizosphaerae]
MISCIGYKVKSLRKEKNIRQDELCCNILNRTILSKIENNKMLPSIPQLEHISHKLGIPIEYFFQNYTASDHNQNSTVSSDKCTALENLYIEKKYFDIIEIAESSNPCDINKNFYVGMSYFNIQLYNDTVTNLTKYIKLYSKFSETDKQKYAINYAFALNKLCFVMMKNSNYEKALKYLYTAQLFLRENNLVESKMFYIIINNIGSICCHKKEYNKVIKTLENFIDNIDDLAYISILASIHLSLNIAYFYTLNFEKALHHIKLAITFFEYSGKSLDAGECYLNYINCLRLLSRFEEALYLISEIKAMYHYDKELINVFSIQHLIILFNIGEFNKLSELLSEIKFNELRRKSKMDYYLIVGHVKFLQGSYTTADNYLNRCKNYLLSRNFYLDLSIVYKDLYQINSSQEDLDKSLYYMKMHENNKTYNIFISDYKNIKP